VPIEISPTIAPTTLRVVASLRAGNRYARAAGSRSLNRVVRHGAAYDRINSRCAASGDCRPRKALTATGKKVRYVAINEIEKMSGRSCSRPQVTMR